MPPPKRRSRSSQSPLVKRRVHTPETDAKIEQLFALHGSRWRTIAAELGDGWSDDIVRNRLVRLRSTTDRPIVPRVVRRAPKRPESKRLWSSEEDARLLSLVEQGVGIVDLCEYFPGRKRQSIRNRKYRLMNTNLEDVQFPTKEGDMPAQNLTYMLSYISRACAQ
jgi:hypothetical protein